MRSTTLFFCSLLSAATACFLGNGSGGDASGDGGILGDADVLPFQADPPTIYVAKVKTILTGLPPTDAEVQQVIADPSSFGSLVDQWMKTPEYQMKMLEFFALAFQQTQIGTGDFVFQLPNGPGGIGQMAQIPLLLQNVRESFARTAYEIAVSENRPFTDLFTTTTFMMTPPLVELYGFMDDWQSQNASGSYTDSFYQANPTQPVFVEESAGPIPIASTLDSKSASYMHWYWPGLKTVDKNGACDVDRTYAAQSYPGTSQILHQLMYGGLAGWTNGSTKCQGVPGTGSNSYFTPADFSNWRMVNIRRPNGAEATTRFFDVPMMQTASEVVFDTPRVGFFSTPAFFANWPTNASNQSRVTVNQAFIVATSTQVDGTDPMQTTSQPGLDTTHAGEQPCFGCHQTLDPSRAIIQATYSYDYGQQTDKTLTPVLGAFQYRGYSQPVSTIYDFGAALAKHPLVPQAWTEKLCFWINSQACASDDPELERIASNFSSTGSWTKLVRDLVTSPITTNATRTQTAAEEGELVAVARKYHLCTALDARLGLTDVCGLDLTKAATSGVPVIANGLPADQYGRGAPVPVLPNQPSLFFRAGVENVCTDVAAMVVDPTKPIAGAKVYSSASQASVDAAVADLVSSLMSVVSSDPRAAPLRAALAQHYADAIAQLSLTPTQALQSTFVVACLTPSVVGIGM